MELEVDFTFSKSYDVYLDADYPSGSILGDIYIYPDQANADRNGSLFVKVKSRFRSKPWYGLFANGAKGKNCVSGIYACPNVQYLLVIASGRGYHVKADAPTDYSDIPIFPIINARPISGEDHDSKVILLSDYSNMAALGADGIAWERRMISADDLKIEGVDSNYVWGMGWNPSASINSKFKLNLKTGKDAD